MSKEDIIEKIYALYGKFKKLAHDEIEEKRKALLAAGYTHYPYEEKPDKPVNPVKKERV